MEEVIARSGSDEAIPGTNREIASPLAPNEKLTLYD
jgi:hypothetical protein